MNWKKNCVFDHVFVGQEEDTEAYISWGTEGWGGTGCSNNKMFCKRL